MRTWKIQADRVPLFCGRCGHDIPKGVRYQQVQIPGVNRLGKRCEQCADESPELQREGATPPIVRPDFTRIGDVDSPLTKDWKAKRMGAA